MTTPLTSRAVPPPEQRPVLGAIAVLLKDDHVLLAQRKNEPDAGLWGYPGGHVEWGETALAAAVRELREETSVVARPLAYLTNIDVIQQARPEVSGHYLLAAVLCDYVAGAPIPADDVSDAAWIPCSDISAGALPMSARVAEVMVLAQGRLGDLRKKTIAPTK